MSDSHGRTPLGISATLPVQPAGAVSGDALSPLRALTVTHRAVGLDSLRSLAVSHEAAARLHETLAAARVESFVVATCNRTEVYWRARGAADCTVVHRAFDGSVGVGAFEGRSVARATPLAGQAAARHLFRVCSGLESMVLGEAEILGQVRAALDRSPNAGPFLEGVVRAALRTGGFARAETGIGVGALSVASAAVQVLAERLPLQRSRVMVVGAGDTGRKAARHLQALGVHALVVANRTLAHARDAAAPLGAAAVSLRQLAGELCEADAVVCAVEAARPVIRLDHLHRAASARPGRGLVVVDLSMPSSVEAGDVAGVSRIDLHAVEAHVERQRGRRAAEIPKVEAVITRELTHLEIRATRDALRPQLRRQFAAQPGATPCS